MWSKTHKMIVPSLLLLYASSLKDDGNHQKQRLWPSPALLCVTVLLSRKSIKFIIPLPKGSQRNPVLLSPKPAMKLRNALGFLCKCLLWRILSLALQIDPKTLLPQQVLPSFWEWISHRNEYSQKTPGGIWCLPFLSLLWSGHSSWTLNRNREPPWIL